MGFYWKCYSIIYLFHNLFFSFSMKHEWGENDKWFFFPHCIFTNNKKIELEKQLQLSTKYTILCRTINVSIPVWVNYIMVLQWQATYIYRHSEQLKLFLQFSIHNLFICCYKYGTFSYEWKIWSLAQWENITFSMFTIRINETVFNIK